jgi:quercetin dioxygenase-like cupin family protein
MTPIRASRTLALVLIAGAIPAACADRTPTATEVSAGSTSDDERVPASVDPPPPIAALVVTGRTEFTDDVGLQIRLKPEGRPRKVVNLDDPSRMTVLRIIVQPGARFPWHTHPGPVLVAVKRGKLIYTYADDCIERTYPRGTALVDPGSNVHYAFNPTGEETVLIATFFNAPPAPAPLTIPVDAPTAAALDAKCGVAPAAAHTH